MQARLFGEQQHRERVESRGELELLKTGEDTGANHDQRRHFRRRIDVAPAGPHVTGNHDGGRGGDKQRAHRHAVVGLEEETRDAGERAEKRERANSAEACGRTRSMTRTLPLDPDGRAPDSRDDQPCDSRTVDAHVGRPGAL